jgi:hypothetical protein
VRGKTKSAVQREIRRLITEAEEGWLSPDRAPTSPRKRPAASRTTETRADGGRALAAHRIEPPIAAVDPPAVETGEVRPYNAAEALRFLAAVRGHRFEAR